MQQMRKRGPDNEHAQFTYLTTCEKDQFVWLKGSTVPLIPQAKFLFFQTHTEEKPTNSALICGCLSSEAWQQKQRAVSQVNWSWIFLHWAGSFHESFCIMESSSLCLWNTKFKLDVSKTYPTLKVLWFLHTFKVIFSFLKQDLSAFTVFTFYVRYYKYL